jgi:hypothetical protein|tara:strand:- start:423 stop:707 length:285 start_codon:yes stop_codon:yes gene_type:complete
MKIFPDIHTVSHSTCKMLQGVGVLNSNNRLVSPRRLSDKMVARKITPQDAKTLVLLELERLPAPRLEVVQRLVNYVSYHGREQTMEKIKKHLAE